MGDIASLDQSLFACKQFVLPDNYDNFYNVCQTDEAWSSTCDRFKPFVSDSSEYFGQFLSSPPPLPPQLPPSTHKSEVESKTDLRLLLTDKHAPEVAQVTTSSTVGQKKRGKSQSTTKVSTLLYRCPSFETSNRQ